LFRKISRSFSKSGMETDILVKKAFILGIVTYPRLRKKLIAHSIIYLSSSIHIKIKMHHKKQTLTLSLPEEKRFKIFTMKKLKGLRIFRIPLSMVA